MKAKATKRTAADGISRMPVAVRNQVCAALRDGASWRGVASICEAAGYAGVTPQNVTNFRRGGYREWLAREERMEVVRRESELTSEILRFYSANGGSPAEAGVLAAAEVMTQALGGMDVGTLKAMIVDDPKKFLDVAKTLKDLATYVSKERPAPVAAPGTQAPGPKGLTKEGQAAIERAAGLI